MTVASPPWAIQASSHPASAVRQSNQGTFGSPFGAFSGGISPTTGGGGHGVVGATDLAVTQNGSPNMSVNVAGGMVAIRGTESAHQGVYGPCYNDATVNLAIAAADPTNARKDLVVAKIRDAQYSGASNDFSLVVVTGTPAGSPVDPAVPANGLVLARVNVAAAASSIVNANITDVRTRASALNAPIWCTSGSRPSGAALYQGLTIYETDTKNVLLYDGSNWTGAHNVALGRIASMNVTANQLIANSSASFGSTAVLTNVPVLANRRIKISFTCQSVESSVTGDIAQLRIVNETPTQIMQIQRYIPVANADVDGNMFVEQSGLSAGLHGWQITVSRVGGTGTCGFTANATAPATLMVEDIGGV